VSLFRSVHAAKDGVDILMREADEDEIAWRERVSAAWLEELLEPEIIFGPGRRHEARLWMVWHLVTCGLEDEAIYETMHRFDHHRCSHLGRSGDRSRVLDRELATSIRGARRRLEMEGE
jgi:hypothetical protein